MSHKYPGVLHGINFLTFHLFGKCQSTVGTGKCIKLGMFKSFKVSHWCEPNETSYLLSICKKYSGSCSSE